MITIVTSPTQSRHQLNRVQYAAYAVALLVIASEYSYGTLKWLSDNAMATGMSPSLEWWTDSKSSRTPCVDLLKTLVADRDRGLLC
jgi:hypothetical protein